jgi:uncharacterized protein YciI
MHFIIIAYDGIDDQALERRMAARDDHLASIKKMKASGKMLYAVAILDEKEKMTGTVIVCDFASRDELDACLKEEPYVTGNVWKKIEIKPCLVPPLFL